ncbi:GNAT family N-acetyltransferase [Microbacterium sp. HJ5]
MTSSMGPLRARAAGLDDAAMVLTWRNDPDTRRMSLQTDVVPLDQHVRWFTASLADPRRVILIVDDTRTGEPVAMCRFDADEAMGTVIEAEVSINLAPEHRGRGYGRPVLEAAIAALEESHPKVQRLRAVIRPENTASLRLFTAAGFVPSGPEDASPRSFVRVQSEASSSHDRGVPTPAS